MWRRPPASRLDGPNSLQHTTRIASQTSNCGALKAPHEIRTHCCATVISADLSWTYTGPLTSIRQRCYIRRSIAYRPRWCGRRAQRKGTARLHPDERSMRRSLQLLRPSCGCLSLEPQTQSQPARVTAWRPQYPLHSLRDTCERACRWVGSARLNAGFRGFG